MIAAWRAAFEGATSEGAAYFAWASDHDRWHSEWLRTLVRELDGNPEVVLAYPLTEQVFRSTVAELAERRASHKVSSPALAEG